LDELATTLIAKSHRLSGSLHNETKKAIANFLRPMNSYYSNLIEGHDTHPIDIDRVLKEDYSDDKAKRNLQLEAKAHINVHKNICEKMKVDNPSVLPTSVDFLKGVHKEFYKHLPEEFLIVQSKEGEPKVVVPGEFRVDEVEVGRHIAPAHDCLDDFMNRFESAYDLSKSTKSLNRRVVEIAASHHRLAWIHPFLDGNGRVVRLYSDACFMYEGLDSSGLWSISRGLARTEKEYKVKLANADLQRQGNYDGRGNLSQKFLVEFCEYFLRTALDQIEFMSKSLDIDTMVNRLEKFSSILSNRLGIKQEVRHILVEVFVRGSVTKTDAMRITNTSDKTLKTMTDKLVDLDLLTEVKRPGLTTIFKPKYPIVYSPYIFPNLYPADKEAELIGLD
jgi:Fic family protein